MKEFNEQAKMVVKVNTARGSGSGFYLKDMDIIVTNHHVVSGQKNVAVETNSKDNIRSQVLQINPLLDLAFLKPANSFDAPVAIFRMLNKVSSRDKVYILGYPFGRPFTVSEGIISSTKQLIGGLQYIQTDAAVNPGNSGGPMMDEEGRILGITTSKFMNAENMGFALPSDQVVRELELFKKTPVKTYSVKCPSCGFLFFEKTKYCENCGIKLDTDVLFADLKLSSLAQFVEQCLKELGIDPVVSRRGNEYWEFYQESALIRVFIYKNIYLFATCPMVKLPKTGITQLYQYMLSNPVNPFYLGLDRNIIYISYRVALTDIDSSYKNQIKENIINMAKKADDLDNYLIDKFGCVWSEESKADS